METSGETVTEFVSAGRFVAETIKFVWSGHMTSPPTFYYSVTGDYRTFKHSPCCISAITNNHCGICGFLRRSSIQQSKLEFWAFLNCKDIIYNIPINVVNKIMLTQCPWIYQLITFLPDTNSIIVSLDVSSY